MKDIGGGFYVPDDWQDDMNGFVMPTTSWTKKDAGRMSAAKTELDLAVACVTRAMRNLQPYLLPEGKERKRLLEDELRELRRIRDIVDIYRENAVLSEKE